MLFTFTLYILTISTVSIYLVYSITYFRNGHCFQVYIVSVVLSSLLFAGLVETDCAEQLDTVFLSEPANPHTDFAILSADRRLGRLQYIDTELGASVRNLIVIGQAIVVIKGRLNHKRLVERYGHRSPQEWDGGIRTHIYII